MIFPLPSKLTSEQKKGAEDYRTTFDRFSGSEKGTAKGPINAAYKTFEKAAISPSIAGTGFIGTPIVAP